MRRTRIAAWGAAGVLALGGAALFVPIGADAATSSSSGDLAATRLTRIKDALKGLVSDGTLTQAQADKVADTLADKGLGGPGGMGPGGMGGMGRGMHGAFAGPEELAKILGISVDDLHSKLQAGKTLAQIAAEKNISKATLIDKLVDAAKAGLATAVKDGRITQAQADQVAADLTTRITTMVDQSGMGMGPMGGHMGGHMGGMGGGGMGRGQWGGGAGSPSTSPTATS